VTPEALLDFNITLIKSIIDAMKGLLPELPSVSIVGGGVLMKLVSLRFKGSS